MRELKNGKILAYEFDPHELGIRRYTLNDLSGKSAAENAKIFHQMIGKKKLARHAAAIKDAVCLNAGAGLYVANKAKTIKEGYIMAVKVIESKKFGMYLKKLK